MIAAKRIIALFIVYNLWLMPTSSIASEVTEKAWNKFLNEDYREAISLADSARDYKSYYIAGLSCLKLGKPQEGRKYFYSLLQEYPGSDLKEEAAIGFADSYFLESEFNSAAIKYNDFLRNFPDSGLKSFVYLRLGQCQRRIGMWQEAKASLTKVVNDFPTGFEKQEAQQELIKEFYYYIQVGSFGKKANAEEYLRRLSRKSYNAYISKMEKEGRAYYRVCIGNFQNRDEALAVLRKLKVDGYKKTKIYP